MNVHSRLAVFAVSKVAHFSYIGEIIEVELRHSFFVYLKSLGTTRPENHVHVPMFLATSDIGVSLFIKHDVFFIRFTHTPYPKI